MNEEKLKLVAGKFPTGVTILTILGEDGDVHGITANSFVSISLKPPLVGFSLMELGNFTPLIIPGMEVGINILSEDQKATSNRYAGVEDNSVPDEQFTMKSNCPILSGCIGWYATKVKQLIPIGDHIFVVSEILDLGESDGSPLLYYAGYKSVGKNL
ncbi:MAG: flavin reductase family protein [Saprospiraceae bacterium]|nr:flavin reductase family protein [Saprospiraceae bacterium]